MPPRPAPPPPAPTPPAPPPPGPPPPRPPPPRPPPARHHPARHHPARHHPARHHPARHHPGRCHPGRCHPGRCHPGQRVHDHPHRGRPPAGGDLHGRGELAVRHAGQRRQQRVHLVGAECQVGRVDVRDQALPAQPLHRERRFPPGHQDQVQPARAVPAQVLDLPPQPGLVEHVLNVVENEHHTVHRTVRRDLRGGQSEQLPRNCRRFPQRFSEFAQNFPEPVAGNGFQARPDEFSGGQPGGQHRGLPPARTGQQHAHPAVRRHVQSGTQGGTFDMWNGQERWDGPTEKRSSHDSPSAAAAAGPAP
jgi:hypothetical protein